MIVRRAAPTDAPRVAALLREAFREHEPRYTRAAFEATCPAAEAIAARLDEGPTWIAIADGRAIGTASAHALPTHLYVRSMAVHPDARGAGVGRALLAEVEAHARSIGIARLRLSTTPFLLAAIRLYERAGFRTIPGGPADLHGTPLLTMEREIGPP